MASSSRDVHAAKRRGLIAASQSFTASKTARNSSRGPGQPRAASAVGGVRRAASQGDLWRKPPPSGGPTALSARAPSTQQQQQQQPGEPFTAPVGIVPLTTTVDRPARGSPMKTAAPPGDGSARVSSSPVRARAVRAAPADTNGGDAFFKELFRAAETSLRGHHKRNVADAGSVHTQYSQLPTAETEFLRAMKVSTVPQREMIERSFRNYMDMAQTQHLRHQKLVHEAIERLERRKRTFGLSLEQRYEAVSAQLRAYGRRLEAETRRGEATLTELLTACVAELEKAVRLANAQDRAMGVQLDACIERVMEQLEWDAFALRLVHDTGRTMGARRLHGSAGGTLDAYHKLASELDRMLAVSKDERLRNSSVRLARAWKLLTVGVQPANAPTTARGTSYTAGAPAALTSAMAGQRGGVPAEVTAARSELKHRLTPSATTADGVRDLLCALNMYARPTPAIDEPLRAFARAFPEGTRRSPFFSPTTLLTTKVLTWMRPRDLHSLDTRIYYCVEERLVRGRPAAHESCPVVAAHAPYAQRAEVADLFPASGGATFTVDGSETVGPADAKPRNLAPGGTVSPDLVDALSNVPASDMPCIMVAAGSMRLPVHFEPASIEHLLETRAFHEHVVPELTEDERQRLGDHYGGGVLDALSACLDTLYIVSGVDGARQMRALSVTEVRELLVVYVARTASAPCATDILPRLSEATGDAVVLVQKTAADGDDGTPPVSVHGVFSTRPTHLVVVHTARPDADAEAAGADAAAGSALCHWIGCLNGVGEHVDETSGGEGLAERNAHRLCPVHYDMAHFAEARQFDVRPYLRAAKRGSARATASAERRSGASRASTSPAGLDENGDVDVPCAPTWNGIIDRSVVLDRLVKAKMQGTVSQTINRALLAADSTRWRRTPANKQLVRASTSPAQLAAVQGRSRQAAAELRALEQVLELQRATTRALGSLSAKAARRTDLHEKLAGVLHAEKVARNPGTAEQMALARRKLDALARAT